MFDFEKPLSFHIEITDKCNARCVQCSRNRINWKGELEERPELCLTEITIDRYKKIFQNYQKQAKAVLFCGNMGDPMFAKDIYEISEYTLTNVLTDWHLKNKNDSLKIYTNGGMRSAKWWYDYGKLLAPYNGLVNFAIDGLEDTHHIYRTNTRYHRVIENATAFMKGGGRAEWSFIRFGHNQHQAEECKQIARDLGFVRFTAVNTQRFYGRDSIDYTWQKRNYSVMRYQPEKTDVQEFKDLNRTDKLWDGKKVEDLSADEINIQTNKNQNKFVEDPEKSRKESAGKIHCHTKARNDVYLDCMGYVHPCCWIGSNEYHRINNVAEKTKYQHMGNEMLDHRDLIPAWEKDFIDILKEDWYQHILPLSWDMSPCRICSRQCGKDKFTTVRQHEGLKA